RNVSLDLEPAETLGLVGESGAGKSTIAKALLGVLPRTLRITQGEILFEGRDRTRAPGPDDRLESGPAHRSPTDRRLETPPGTERARGARPRARTACRSADRRA